MDHQRWILAHTMEKKMTIPSWAKAEKIFPDGRIAHVVPMLFTHRLTVGSPESMEMGCYDDGWCYHNLASALTALDAWDGSGEPTGWHRHPPSGRRRENGDPAKEIVRL